jgi:hypothetical protein
VIPVHPTCNKMPLAAVNEIRKLRGDIKEHGLQEDHRNRLAAFTLPQPADASDDDVSPERKASLAKYTGTRLVKVADEIAREVAFRCFPADLNDFVELVLERLAEDALPVAPAPVSQSAVAL